MPEVVEETVFEGILSFMRELGFFKVLIPFLLSFVLVYAILDKTKVLGTDNGKPEGDPKRSLNSIVSFSIALFVIGSELVVGIINQALANVVVVLLLVVFFLMTVSVFLKEGQINLAEDYKAWMKFFMFFIFAIFIIIFLAAMGWLIPIMDWIKANWTQDYVATIIFLLAIAAFIFFITREGGKSSSDNAGG